MNAKELRQSANKLLDQNSYDSTTVEDYALDLANHILATVREDDDELADDEWQGSVLRDSGCTLNTIELVYSTWDKSLRPSNRTKGQFRALCQGLGIELKEKSHGS